MNPYCRDLLAIAAATWIISVYCPECIQGSDKPNEIAWNFLPLPAEGNASRE